MLKRQQELTVFHKTPTLC